MNKQEKAVYEKAVKEKYKHHKLWKVLALVFMGLTILFATLYFASGDVFRHTENNVEIVNENAENNVNNVEIHN